MLTKIGTEWSKEWTVLGERSVINMLFIIYSTKYNLGPEGVVCLLGL